ncbi:heavy metal-responsive transcriptional regulator [Thermoflexus sp.]|uniref:heavy metal-responsive transcriptional regulator n=1 Tax=Thermoflexus sp. TaxID=1969742 RepID=UPI0035E42FD0
MRREDAFHAMRIGQLAAELGLNPKTIRYYEEIGLLPRPARTPAGYRLYRPADRDRLQFILKAKAIGFSLKEIKEILALRQAGEQPCAHVLALLDQKIAAIDRQLAALAAFRQELVDLREEAIKTMGGESHICGIIEHYERSPQLGQKLPPRETSA